MLIHRLLITGAAGDLGRVAHKALPSALAKKATRAAASFAFGAFFITVAT
jgi:hypothetical protein